MQGKKSKLLSDFMHDHKVACLASVSQISTAQTNSHCGYDQNNVENVAIFIVNIVSNSYCHAIFMFIANTQIYVFHVYVPSKHTNAIHVIRGYVLCKHTHVIYVIHLYIPGKNTNAIYVINVRVPYGGCASMFLYDQG